MKAKWTHVRTAPADDGGVVLKFLDGKNHVIAKGKFSTYEDADTCADIVTLLNVPAVDDDDEEIELWF